ncbi:hypothetical protein [Bacillus sp. FJAT-52991]|uniref:Uncharacterized protein n=1 Tax=Bacillus kandeliae TaxID=3129297 RepID=A0ABZ2N7Q7_9BACI
MRIEQNVELDKRLGGKINNSQEIKLLSPIRLNVVCFSLNKESITTEMNNQFLTSLNQQGKVLMTPMVYNGVPSIHAVFSNWRTEEKDVDIIWEVLVSTVF